MRTGPSSADLWTTVADPHQTVTIAINNNAKPSEGVLKRRMDPWGNPRGTNPTWPTDRGYLNKPTDSTGLTSIGARYYDAAFGRFISVDPIMNLADPGQWGPYEYANNNPVSQWDPTGLQAAVKGDWEPGTGPGSRAKPLSGWQKVSAIAKGVGSAALGTVKTIGTLSNPISATWSSWSQYRYYWNYYTNPKDARSFWDKAGAAWSAAWRGSLPWTMEGSERERYEAWGGFGFDVTLMAAGGAGAAGKLVRAARASRVAAGAAESGGGGLLARLRAINWADDTGSISLPGNRLRPNYAAEGPHSTFRTGPDGSVTHYATWEPQSNPLNPAPWQMVKRVDVVGDPHFNKVTGTYVDTPHVQGPSIPGGVRPAEPWELP